MNNFIKQLAEAMGDIFITKEKSDSAISIIIKGKKYYISSTATYDEVEDAKSHLKKKYWNVNYSIEYLEKNFGKLIPSKEYNKIDPGNLATPKEVKDAFDDLPWR